MKHPNAIAALIAGAAVYGLQYVLARYAHTSLSDDWSKAVNVGVTAAVLWVGREGIRGALLRLWRGTKAVWSGSSKDEPAA